MLASSTPTGAMVIGRISLKYFARLASLLSSSCVYYGFDDKKNATDLDHVSLDVFLYV